MASVNSVIGLFGSQNFYSCWDVQQVTGTGIVASQTGGRLRFAADATSPNSTVVLSRDTALDLSGTSLSVEMPTVSGDQTDLSMIFQAEVDDNNKVGFRLASPNIQARKVVGGVTTTVWTDTYNSTTHRWLQVYEDGGITVWATSTDGHLWVIRHSESTPITLTDVYIEISVNRTGTPGGTATIELDNLNVTSTHSKALVTIGSATGV